MRPCAVEICTFMVWEYALFRLWLGIYFFVTGLRVVASLVSREEFSGVLLLYIYGLG